MQAYGPGFAKVYDERWSRFAQQIAPRIRSLYERRSNGPKERSVLDLCCGSGRLSVHFLEEGYRVVGLDLSEAMLRLARENVERSGRTERASFVHADAADFELDDRFGLVVSVFDSLNHLPDEESLGRCFRCVRRVCNHLFVFDLNTRLGLNRWNNVSLDEGDDLFLATRGIYDGEGDRAWMRITGFSRTAEGLYERFDETAFNTVFRMARVEELLHAAGWRHISFAAPGDLETPVDDPESLGRVFVVAR